MTLAKSLFALTAIASVANIASAASTGTAKPPTPRITAAQAEAAATRKISGKALSAKYEFEDGRWQYAVAVQHGTKLYEVEVSAKDGHVLDSEQTTAAEEKSEAASDAKAAQAKHSTH